MSPPPDAGTGGAPSPSPPCVTGIGLPSLSSFSSFLSLGSLPSPTSLANSLNFSPSTSIAFINSSPRASGSGEAGADGAGGALMGGRA